MLEKEYAFFKKNVKQFIEDHPGQYVVIKDEEALGFYDTEQEAFMSMRNEELGTFMVTLCAEESIRTQRFRSRVSFV